jgi:hypothetical protein
VLDDSKLKLKLNDLRSVTKTRHGFPALLMAMLDWLITCEHMTQ